MKFSAKTLKILKNFNDINPSMLFTEGNIISTMSPHKSILARATIEETIPQNFAIFEISRLLAIISILDDPEIICEDKWLVISSGRSRIRYTYCNPSTIVHPPIGKQMTFPEPQVQFSLDSDVYSNCIKAMSVLGAPNLVIKGENGILSLVCTNTETPTSDLYSVDIGKTEKEFEVIFKNENLKIINNNYSVGALVPTSKDGIGMSYWKSDDVEYFIAIETKSWLK